MADSTKKAQKLAAARKKLKEFQQKNVKPVKSEEHPASSVTTTNSSRHSSISNDNSIDHTPERVSFEAENLQSSSPLHNYFNGHEQKDFYIESNRLRTEDSINFFDNLPVHNSSSVPNNYQFDLKTNDDVKSLDYPEVESRSVYGYFGKEEHPTVSSEDAKRLSEFLGSSDISVAPPLVNQDLKPPYIDYSASPDISISSHNLNDQYNGDINLQKPTESGTEVVADLNNEPTQSVVKLECLIPDNHNDFASQLREQYQLKIEHLESKLEQNKIEYERTLSTELHSLQERLDAHVKTIEIHIAENNRLSDSLHQSQTLLNDKVRECEELQGRLKTSRSRVADLEKELQAVKLERTKLDQSHLYEVQINQLVQQCEELKQSKEESAQDILELREKLNIKVNASIGLQRELQDVTHQLSQAHIKIQQISMGENSPSHSNVELLTQQKTELEKQILGLLQTLKTMGEEKVQTNIQYQHYVQQLNAQVATLANKLETLTTENDMLSKREQSLIKHIGELEKHVQGIHEEKVNFSINKSGNTEIKKELDAALELTGSLQKEKEELQERYQHICTDQDELLAELATKKHIIEQLESDLERLTVDQPNNVKLLATIESDKVAAARAVTQNATLKQSLEEMQQAFVRMSNDKLDLTEQLSTEKYKNHELEEHLSSLEIKLHTLSDAIEIKDNELTHIRETMSHQNKQLLQNNQLTDRLRHYEAQDGSNSALQENLQQAQERINELLEENFKLKDVLTSNTNDKSTVSSEKSDTEVTVDMKETQTHSDQLDISKLDNTLDKEIAMKHLEDKFTRTMTDVANLIEEKQRLEHIVLQLQGETDTIGEYIALYQHQRGILQQRTLEKEEQLRRLTNDRINVKDKLEAINDLVNKLVHDKGITPEILKQHDALANNLHDSHPGHESCTHTHNVPLNNSEGENNNVGSETADQILQLLSEIKASNLVQPCDGLGSFHPCSCCSGQLFTV